MKKSTVFVAALLLSTNVALADGHGLWPMIGFQTATSTEMMEGMTGTIMHLTSNDAWDYSQAPDGWPTIVEATCHNSVVMLPDGDASIWRGQISPTFGYDGKLLAGTGKYVKMAGAEFSGQVTGQLANGSSIYHVKPK